MMSLNSRHLSPLLSGSVILLASLLFSQTVEPNADMSAFGKMIPAGFINREVVIPSFDDLGRKTSELTAATVTRIDDDRLQAGQVSISIFSLEPKENIQVKLPSALYNLSDKILRSGERSTITRSDLETSGDTLVFDSATSIGSMSGRVRTLIFDTGAVSHETSKAETPDTKDSN